MDSVAKNVIASISNLLENDERRYKDQQSKQEHHDVAIENFKARLEALEKRCEELTNQNICLKNELDAANKRNEDTRKDIITQESDVKRMQEQVKECVEWAGLVSALTAKVDLVDKSMQEKFNGMLEKSDEMHKNHCEVFKRHQRHINTIASTANQALAIASSSQQSINTNPLYNGNSRMTVRSPSTSSFFSSNFHNNNNYQPIHSPSPQMNKTAPTHQGFHHTHHTQYHSHMPKDDYQSSIDPSYELQEISEDAECLIKNVHKLNDLHRSFEKNSICSDDHYIN